MEDLEKIRDEINSVDQRIIEALAARRKLAEQIIRTKSELGAPLRDELREEQVLEHLISMGRGVGLDAHLVTRVFHEIIDDSIRSQQLHLLDYDKSGIKRVVFWALKGLQPVGRTEVFAPFIDQTVFVGSDTMEDC